MDKKIVTAFSLHTILFCSSCTNRQELSIVEVRLNEVKYNLLQAQSEQKTGLMALHALIHTPYKPQFHVGANGGHYSPGYDFRPDLSPNNTVYAQVYRQTAQINYVGAKVVALIHYSERHKAVTGYNYR